MSEEDIAHVVCDEWSNFTPLSFLPNTPVVMPRYINFMWIHYNWDALDDAGVSDPDINWRVDDMAEASEKLTTRAFDGSVKRFGHRFAIWSFERMLYHLERFGGAFVIHGQPDECRMDLPESQVAFEWMRQRLWDDHTGGEPHLMERSPSRPCPNGQTAMAETVGPRCTWKRDTVGTFPIDFYHPPSGPVERTSYMVTGGFVMSKGTK